MARHLTGTDEMLSTPLLARGRAPGLSRREFLTKAALGAAAAAVLGARWASRGEAAGTLDGSAVLPVSHSVIEIRTCRTVIDGGRVRQKLLREMLEECVKGLAGEADAAAAWGRYVRPGQRVLLKFSDSRGGAAETDLAMLTALVESLEAAGCRRGDIAAVECPGAVALEGLRPAAPGWSARRVRVRDSSEQVRRYLDEADVILNVPGISDHSLAGLACGMVNLSLPLIRRPAQFFEGQVHEAVVDVCSDAELSSKTTLTIANALWVLLDGAPAAGAENLVCTRSVWASTDVVAVDALALQWLERFRHVRGLGGLREAGRPARYVALAGERGLGQADLRRVVQRKREV